MTTYVFCDQNGAAVADQQTPVCTTELSAVALSYADFQSRGVKVRLSSRMLQALGCIV